MIKSIGWMAILRGFAKSLAVAKTFILARILTPAQFGIFGIASLVLGFLEIITETGINVVLIQQKEIEEKNLNSAWIVSIIRGIVLFMLIFILAPLIAMFFNNDGATKILYLTAFIPLVRGFINPAEVKFQKELDFKKEFIFKATLIFVEIVSTVVIGFITRSEYSIVWGLLLSAIAEVVFSLSFISPKPKAAFDLDSFKFVFKRGIWITFAGAFNYLFSHGDDVVVGKLLGVTPLGLYQQGYRISSLPVTEVAEVFQKVTFPYYSKYKEDKNQLKNTFLKSFLWTSMLAVPFGIFIILFPELVINILLGPNWIEIKSTLQILAVFGIVKSLANSVFPLFLGLGKQNWVTYITLVSIMGMTLVIFPLTMKFGINGTALATIIGSLVAIPPSLVMVYKLLKK